VSSSLENDEKLLSSLNNKIWSCTGNLKSESLGTTAKLAKILWGTQTHFSTTQQLFSSSPELKKQTFKVWKLVFSKTNTYSVGGTQVAPAKIQNSFYSGTEVNYVSFPCRLNFSWDALTKLAHQLRNEYRRPAVVQQHSFCVTF